MKGNAKTQIEYWQKMVKIKAKGRPAELKDPITGMEFVYVDGGCYQMGDTFGVGGSDEIPVHEVCIDDFYIGKYEVTQGQWKAIMEDNPSKFDECGDNCPVEKVSWDDIQEFITKLNEKITPLNPPLTKGEVRGLQTSDRSRMGICSKERRKERKICRHKQ